MYIYSNARPGFRLSADNVFQERNLLLVIVDHDVDRI
jgi:hypothetical protein